MGEGPRIGAATNAGAYVSPLPCHLDRRRAFAP